MGKNVLIPILLMKRIIALLDCWDTSTYDRFIRHDHADVRQALIVKMRKLELRDAYAEIINADSDDNRYDAHANYLWLRDRLDDFSTDD